MRSRAIPYEGSEPYIFLSYCHKDKEVIYPILDQFAQNNYRVWYDDGNIAGSNWPENISRHLIHSAVCLAFLSEASEQSHNCRKEFNFSIQRKIKTVPVRIGEFPMSLATELLLSDLHYLQISPASKPSAILSMLRDIPEIQKCLSETPLKLRSWEELLEPEYEEDPSIDSALDRFNETLGKGRIGKIGEKKGVKSTEKTDRSKEHDPEPEKSPRKSLKGGFHLPDLSRKKASDAKPAADPAPSEDLPEIAAPVEDNGSFRPIANNSVDITIGRDFSHKADVPAQSAEAADEDYLVSILPEKEPPVDPQKPLYPILPDEDVSGEPVSSEDLPQSDIPADEQPAYDPQMPLHSIEDREISGEEKPEIPEEIPVEPIQPEEVPDEEVPESVSPAPECEDDSPDEPTQDEKSGDETILISRTAGDATDSDATVRENAFRSVLVIQPDAGKVQLFRKAQVIIGRRKGSCDVVVDSKTISSSHAMIIQDKGTFTLADNDSTNGTYLRGEEITHVPVENYALFYVHKTPIVCAVGSYADTLAKQSPIVFLTNEAGTECRFLDSSVMPLNRSRENRWPDGTLNDTMIHREKHAEIQRRDGEVVLVHTKTDGGNGTFLNDTFLEPLEPAQLLDGDKIRLGGTVLTVHIIHP